jgi:hypothetical protein
MRRSVGRFATAVGVAALVSTISVASVGAAAAKTSYEAVAANHGSMSSAVALQAKLTKAGLTGFTIEKENTGTKGHFQVEQSFSTKAAAQAEVAKLKAAKYHGGVETDAAGGV